jgi:two-component system chemotaxis sensor kinase CheA
MGEDEEILQDFMVEAGEILEQLSEQLVDLERSPEDTELLNAIFRGFHTVKGGAGFLQFEAVVDCCHVAENVFDTLRKGECELTSELMDTVLKALDCVNTMFDEIRSGTELTPAEPELIDTLAKLAAGEKIEAPATDKIVQEKPAPDKSNEELISDDEFELLLDALNDEKKVEAVDDVKRTEAPVMKDSGFEGFSDPHPQSDEITEDEFEALLNQFSIDKDVEGGPSEKIPSVAAKEPAPIIEPVAVKEPSASKESLAHKEPVAAIVPKVKKETLNAVPSNKVISNPKPPAAKMPTKDNVTEATVRVDTKRLDDIMNMVGELVLVRNRLVRLGSTMQDEDMNKAVSNLDVVTADLQSSVMKTRMQPIKKVFGRFPRVVRDLARNLEKEINLELKGEETDLDKNLVEALADPLVHLVRNSVDHGIESPFEREAAGKPRVGTILLSAQQEGDHILLIIQDDGKGMDPNVIREIAITKGAIERDVAERLSDAECFNLIFAPGFSTKEIVSDVSGRGVGMDVVKTKIGQLNGTVDIESKLGEGSQIIIKVPLTLAIMPTLMVMLADQTFALPLVSVNEIFHLDLRDTNVVDGQEVIIVRDKALPLYFLSRWLTKGSNNAANDISESHVVIVTVGSQKIGFVVDQLIGQEEVVIKPLGKMLQGTAGMAGATITGDGTIALILDVPSMLKRYG